ncbi:hypothetical protein L596_018848 [Steinernema carpocapsae]|uniref:SH3 domain-containing protein n=1 Tax=Steinernema carpocapsae TaxID=34508 RepID=A0A4U5N6C8_STECR|nr:hypothetical protein L596_018848 [Steinernema carpocapsae]
MFSALRAIRYYLGNPSSPYTILDEAGFEFVNWCIKSIEEKGIREQGIYRNCGVTSKVQKMMQVALDKRKSSAERMAFGEEIEWETKTISSAIKTFLRNLPEPLMTFELHNHFINAAKMDDQKERVGHIHYYVYQLPESHKRMLEIIIRHLRRVADRHNENLMTVGNLGVCFGPTLLRPKEETMAAIMDIKFCNVVVEVLIAHCQKIFGSPPPSKIGAPCPPKPLHTLGSSSTASNNNSNKNDYTTSSESSSLSRPKTIAPQPPQPFAPTAAESTSHLYDSVPLASAESSFSDVRFGALANEPSSSTATTPNEQRRSENNSESHNAVSPSVAAKNKMVASSYAPSYSSFPSESRRVKTLYACTAGHETELTFAPNQIITNVYESKEEGWLVGTLNGKTGLIPANYVEPLP